MDCLCSSRMCPSEMYLLFDVSNGVSCPNAHSLSSNAEPTPSEDVVSMRLDRLRIVRQYDAAVEYILEATLGRISKLLDNGVVGESVSHYYPEYSGADPGRISNVPQEEHSEESSSVKENVFEVEDNKTSAAPYQQQRQLLFFAAVLFLYFSGALGRYARFGRDLAYGW